MNYELYKKEEQQLNQWAAEGFGASIIDSTQEEAEFEATPGYDRILFIINGDVVLACEGDSVSRLKSWEQAAFTGGTKAKCFGSFKGYCLAVKEEGQGLVDLIELDSKQTIHKINDLEEYEKASQGFYCLNGYAVITMEKEPIMLKEGEQVFLYGTKAEQNQVGIMGEGRLIRTQVFDQRRKDAAPKPSEIDSEWNPAIEEEIPREKATFADFFQTVKICVTNFRAAKYLFKFVKNNWYDEALQAAIDKIQKKYIPVFVWLVGVLILCGVGSKTFTLATIGIAVILWSLVDIFFVTPLLYFFVVPKPVKAHIKPIDQLTEREQKIRQKQLDTVPKAEKVLKRYK